MVTGILEKVGLTKILYEFKIILQEEGKFLSLNQSGYEPLNF